jgi:hypothetical protein
VREKYEDSKRVINSDGQKTQCPTEKEANNDPTKNNVYS